eukprot:gene4871-8465_t
MLYANLIKHKFYKKLGQAKSSELPEEYMKKKEVFIKLQTSVPKFNETLVLYCQKAEKAQKAQKKLGDVLINLGTDDHSEVGETMIKMGEMMKTLAQIQHAMLVNQIDKIVKPNLKIEESFKGISQVQKNFLAKQDEIDAQENYIETLPENDPRRGFALEKLEELKAVRDQHYEQACDALDSIVNEKETGFLSSVCQLILNFHSFGEETISATEKKKERFQKLMKKKPSGGDKKKTEKKQEIVPVERKSKAKPPTSEPPLKNENDERKSNAKPPSSKPPPLDTNSQVERKKSGGAPPRPSNDGKMKLLNSTEVEVKKDIKSKGVAPPRPSNDSKPITSKGNAPPRPSNDLKPTKVETTTSVTQVQSKFQKVEKKVDTTPTTESSPPQKNEEESKVERKLSTFQMNQQKIGGMIFDPKMMLKQSKQFQRVSVVEEKVEEVQETPQQVEEVQEVEEEKPLRKMDSRSKMMHRMSMITDPLLYEETKKIQKETEKKMQNIKSPEPKVTKKSLGDAIVLYDYDAQDKTEISLKEGDIIKVYKKNEDDWWLVGLDSKEGLFPANFLSEETKTKALYAYTALEDGELSFKEGEMIKILKKNEDGWWVGELKSKVGLFPVNYTEIGQ